MQPRPLRRPRQRRRCTVVRQWFGVAGASDKGGCLLQLGPLFQGNSKFPLAPVSNLATTSRGKRTLRAPGYVQSSAPPRAARTVLCVMAVAFSQYSRDLWSPYTPSRWARRHPLCVITDSPSKCCRHEYVRVIVNCRHRHCALWIVPFY